MTETARKFRAGLDEVHRVLVSLPEGLADVPWRKGGWTGVYHFESDLTLL